MYLQSEKAYRIWADPAQIHLIKSEGEIIKYSTIIYQEQPFDDELSEGEEGVHHYIDVYKETKTSHYFQLNEYSNVVGYYESFYWENGTGLSSYTSGFGAEADLLELKRNEN